MLPSPLLLLVLILPTIKGHLKVRMTFTFPLIRIWTTRRPWQKNMRWRVRARLGGERESLLLLEHRVKVLGRGGTVLQRGRWPPGICLLWCNQRLHCRRVERERSQSLDWRFGQSIGGRLEMDRRKFLGVHKLGKTQWDPTTSAAHGSKLPCVLHRKPKMEWLGLL